MIVDINYDDAVRDARLTSNSYATQYTEEREAILAGLRHRYRDVRRVLVTFASGQRYVDRQRIFAATAAATGEFHTAETWTFDRLRTTPFFADNRDILQRAKGQGYWLWKPYVIWRALETSQDGDLIVYNDSLPEDGNVLGRSILPMLGWLSGGERRIAVTRKPAPNSAWTKRDCFVRMGCDSPPYWKQNQIIATYMAFLASASTRRLLNDWLTYCRDPRILTDDPNTSGLENFPDFQDHRHDQSVLSNLLVRDDFTLPDVLFGRDITTKNFQDLLGMFENALVIARLKEACISFGKPWTQSSASPWSPVQGLMADLDPGRDFFFHTDAEENPWWRLDLEALYQVNRIEIINRPDVFGWRANRLQVWMGPELDDLNLIFDAVAANWDAVTPLVLHVSKIARYIVVNVDNTTNLHLKHVSVHGIIR